MLDHNMAVTESCCRVLDHKMAVTACCCRRVRWQHGGDCMLLQTC